MQTQLFGLPSQLIQTQPFGLSSQLYMKATRRVAPAWFGKATRRVAPAWFGKATWRVAPISTPTLTTIGIKNHKVQKIEKDFQLLVHLHWEYSKRKKNIKLKLIRRIRRRVPRKSVGLLWSKYSPKVSIKMDLIRKNFKIKSRKRDG